jgi:hypothetical protein
VDAQKVGGIGVGCQVRRGGGRLRDGEVEEVEGVVAGELFGWVLGWKVVELGGGSVEKEVCAVSGN